MTEADVTTTLDVRPVTGIIGAEVHGVDLRRPLEPAVVAEITEALLRWKVLFFRDQPLTQDQHVAFARAFGEPTAAHPVHAGVADQPNIYAVETGQLKGSPRRRQAPRPFAPGPSTQTGWHTDITFVPNPAMGSILRGVVIPPAGGDTLWTNLVAAYEDLSPPIRDLIDGLQAVHRWRDYDGLAKREDHDPTAPPPTAVHPVVRVHPDSGERALVREPHVHPLPGGVERPREHADPRPALRPVGPPRVHGAVPLGARQPGLLGQPGHRPRGPGRPGPCRLRPLGRAHHAGR